MPNIRSKKGGGYLVQPRVFFFVILCIIFEMERALSELPCKGFLSNPIAVVGVGGGGFARPLSGGAKESHETHDPADKKLGICRTQVLSIRNGITLLGGRFILTHY